MELAIVVELLQMQSDRSAKIPITRVEERVKSLSTANQTTNPFCELGIA